MTTPFPLGRLVEHDPRSRNFAFAPPTITPVVAKTWRRFGYTLDQGDVGSCTGNAMAHAINTDPLHILRTPCLSEAKALDLYSLATQLDEFPGYYPNEDTGSSGLAVCKAAKQLGYITEYRWAFGFDATLQALMHGPVMVGTWWTEDMFYPDSKGVVTYTGPKVGGHEYVLLGVWVKARMLIFQNSWSSAWGLRGRFYMSFDEFGRMLADEGDAVVPVRGTV